MTQPPIDSAVYSALQETVGAEFVAELVSTFLDEAPAMMADLQAAHGAADADGFRRAAHSLKSNANVFGATPLAEAARALELGGLDSGNASSFAALQYTCDAALAALKDLVDA